MRPDAGPLSASEGAYGWTELPRDAELGTSDLLARVFLRLLSRYVTYSVG